MTKKNPQKILLLLTGLAMTQFLSACGGESDTLRRVGDPNTLVPPAFDAKHIDRPADRTSGQDDTDEIISLTWIAMRGAVYYRLYRTEEPVPFGQLPSEIAEFGEQIYEGDGGDISSDTGRTFEYLDDDVEDFTQFEYNLRACVSRTDVNLCYFDFLDMRDSAQTLPESVREQIP